MKIFESKYRSIEFFSEYSLIINEWKESTKELSNELFKEDMLKYLEQVLKKYCPERIVHYGELFAFIISPTLQTWVDNTINQTAIDLGTKKWAFVLPRDMFSKISVEQTMDESASKVVEVSHFEDRDLALEWIKTD